MTRVQVRALGLNVNVGVEVSEKIGTLAIRE